MSWLFDRFIEVTVTKDGKNGLQFGNLRISFEATKSSGSNPNTGKVKIYNLNDNSVGIIEEENQKLVLEVGYRGLAVVDKTTGKVKKIPTKEIVLVGDILHVETIVNGSDRITVIEVGDGEKSLTQNTLDKSFPAGVTKKQIIDELVGSLDLVKGAIQEVTDKVFNKGYSATGKSKDQLDTILDSEGLEMSVQDGEVQIINKDGSTNEPPVLLSPQNGLLGTPARKKGKDGVNFKSLLNPLLRPGRKVSIESRTVSGIFVIKKCVYLGDSNEGEFICNGEAK
jgi:hypothetical protein